MPKRKCESKGEDKDEKSNIKISKKFHQDLISRIENCISQQLKFEENVRQLHLLHEKILSRKTDNVWTKIYRHLTGEYFKIFMSRILSCGDCKKMYLDLLLYHAIIDYNCGINVIKLLLEQGANPNAVTCKIEYNTTMEHTVVSYYNYSIFGPLSFPANVTARPAFPEVFYWLVIYGSEFNYKDVESKHSNIFDVFENGLSHPGQNIISKALEELRRGTARMRQELILHCPLPQVRVKIVFNYLLWSR